jgi:hypothetical protein
MAVWRVKSEGDAISFGSFERKKFNRNGCNEPFKNAFWCPKKRWFAKEPCPFVNKWECMNYARFCGAI